MSNSRRQIKPYLKSAFTLGLIAISLGSAAAADQKADPTGSWKWERTFGDNTVQYTLRLELQDDKVRGSYASTRGEAKVEQGQLDGDQLSFHVRREFNERKLTIKFRGKVTEDAIKGKGEYSFDGNSREFDWEAKRFVARADVLGTWDLQVETLYADFIEAKLVVREESGELTGEYSDKRGEAEVESIAVDGTTLTIDVVGESNGIRWKQAFEGKPRGDAVKGTYDYDSAGRSGTLTFHGKRIMKKKAEEE